MCMCRRIWILLLITFSYAPVWAQVDAHFTQYYAHPLWLNPAMTGVNDGDYRVGANYRYQWPSINAPFITKGVSADMRLSDRWGIGVNLLNQVAKDAGYYYNNGYLSISYRVPLTEYHILSGGFQIGVLNRGIDIGKFQFGNQYNPIIGYDPGMPNNELFLRQTATSLDGSIGLMYFDATPDKNFNLFFGASLYHPNQPDNRFLSGAENSKVPMRYAIHGGVRLSMGDRAELVPHAVYLRQGDASEITGGVLMNYTLSDDKALMTGATWRMNDAVAPQLGLHVNGLTIGFSYDINISRLKTASSYQGGYELSVSFTGRKKLSDLKFVCPKL